MALSSSIPIVPRNEPPLISEFSHTSTRKYPIRVRFQFEMVSEGNIPMASPISIHAIDMHNGRQVRRM
jgi:hypothetical protein